MEKTARNQCELNISEKAKKKEKPKKNQSEMFLEFRSQKGKIPKTTERGQDQPHRRSKWSFISKPG